MKNYILLLSLLSQYLTVVAQEKKSDHIIANISFIAPETLLLRNMDEGPNLEDYAGDYTSLWELEWEDLNVDKFTSVHATKSIEGYMIVPYLNFHSNLHLNRYIIISYLGEQRASCFITDQLGEVVYSYPAPLSNTKTWIDIGSLEDGEYFFQIKSEGHVYQQNLSKH